MNLYLVLSIPPWKNKEFKKSLKAPNIMTFMSLKSINFLQEFIEEGAENSPLLRRTPAPVHLSLQWQSPSQNETISHGSGLRIPPHTH